LGLARICLLYFENPRYIGKWTCFGGRASGRSAETRQIFIINTLRFVGPAQRAPHPPAQIGFKYQKAFSAGPFGNHLATPRLI
jgi:hypothetical protein